MNEDLIAKLMLQKYFNNKTLLKIILLFLKSSLQYKSRLFSDLTDFCFSIFDFLFIISVIYITSKYWNPISR